jgi:hypothetical protein
MGVFHYGSVALLRSTNVSLAMITCNDQDIASETSNSRTEVGESTFGSMDAPSAVGNEGAFSRLV